MQFYQVTNQDLVLKHKFTSYVSKMIPLPEYKLFIYFGNGNYSYWDLQKSLEEPINVGKIQPDIKYLEPFDSQTIILYDEKKLKMTLLNLKQGLIDENNHLKDDLQEQLKAVNLEQDKEEDKEEQQNTENIWEINDPQNITKLQEEEILEKQRIEQEQYNKYRDFEAIVPTNTVLSGANRNDNNAISDIVEKTQILVFQKSNYLVLTEQKFNYNSNDTQNIITTFRPNIQKLPLHTITINTHQKFSSISALNDTDTIIIWQTQFTKKPLEFYLYDIKKNEKKQKFTIDKQFSLTVIDVTQFGQNKLAFWTNPMCDGIPLLIIYDYQNFNFEQVSLNLYQGQPYILQEVIDVDLELKKAVFTIIIDESTLEVLNLETNTITYSQSTGENVNTTNFQIDKKCFVQYEEEYQCNEPEQNPSEIQLRYCMLSNMKYIVLNMMEQTGILDLYQETIAAKVIDVLTQEPTKEQYELWLQLNNQYLQNEEQEEEENNQENQNKTNEEQKQDEQLEQQQNSQQYSTQLQTKITDKVMFSPQGDQQQSTDQLSENETHENFNLENSNEIKNSEQLLENVKNQLINFDENEDDQDKYQDYENDSQVQEDNEF